MAERQHKFTREQLVAAFQIWQDQAKVGEWETRDDPRENAVAGADHLISILESESISG